VKISGLLYGVVWLQSERLKFTLEQTMKAQRRSTGIPYSFFNLDARWGRWFKDKPRLLYTANDPVTIVEDVR
jgi:hypothetical protein